MHNFADLRLIFEDNSIGNLNLTPDWIDLLWTSPIVTTHDQPIVTVIEFSRIALQILSRTNYSSLTYAPPIETREIRAFDGKGGEAHGSIDKVEGEFFRYKIETQVREHSGFLLLNHHSNAIGIDVGSFDIANELTRKAIAIQSIFKAFQAHVQKIMIDRNRSEFWLEQIKKNKLNNMNLIGSGSYSTVFKIRDSNSTQFALKEAGGFGALECYTKQVHSLEKEFSLVSKLHKHQRIIEFFAFIRDDEHAKLMIVMEYLEGGSLRDKIQNHNNSPLPNDSVLKYLVQILEGVEFLHQNKIYHSDIKPANILFTAEDNLKICDFGISTQIGNASS